MAIEADMPQTYNLLAIINVMDVWFGTPKSKKKSLLHALELTQKALDIDEHNVEAYTILCFTYATQRKPDKAVEAGRKAIELNPNSDEAHAWLALPLIWTGKPLEVIEFMAKRWLYSNKELTERWNDILRKAGIPED